jgi:hypothetical protein
MRLNEQCREIFYFMFFRQSPPTPLSGLQLPIIPLAPFWFFSSEFSSKHSLSKSALSVSLTPTSNWPWDTRVSSLLISSIYIDQGATGSKFSTCFHDPGYKLKFAASVTDTIVVINSKPYRIVYSLNGSVKKKDLSVSVNCYLIVSRQNMKKVCLNIRLIIMQCISWFANIFLF